MCDVRIDSNGVAGVGTEIVEEFSDAGVPVCVGFVRVDDPDLAQMDGCCEGSVIGVSGDELHVLDSAAVGDGDCGDDGVGVEIPETESVGVLDSQRRFEDGDGHDEIGCEANAFFVIYGEAVGRKLRAQNVESSIDVIGVLVDDVEVRIKFYEAARGGT